jgi:glycosyltransferase involved in cell wall biosynthesis
MKLVCIVGCFCVGKDLGGGQVVKTKVITNELKKQFGLEQVEIIDTYGGLKKIHKITLNLLHKFKTSRNIVILPAQNGIKFLAPICLIFNIFFKRKLHYIVIGGWLPNFLAENQYLVKCLKKFNYIYVETNSMLRDLNKIGLKNVMVMPNCKELDILSESELIYNTSPPFRLCTFSRVLKEKGIEDAVKAVENINEKYKSNIFSLDIYGQIENTSENRKWFELLSDKFPPYIKYCGTVPYNKSTDVLKNYYALLFPTYYEGEGLAGTLIDAAAAGVPVIASDWKYNTEIVIDNWNGLIFPARDIEALQQKLIYIYENQTEWNNKKKVSLSNASKYMSKNVVQILIDKL